MYRYDQYDHQLVRERVVQFRDQVRRRLNNELAEQAGMDPGNWQYPSRITVQTTEYVGQGQVAWFVIQLRAPSVMGSYRVHIRPVIDGVTWMEDYGVYFDLTVVAR